MRARRFLFAGAGPCPPGAEELWIDDAASVDTYARTWRTLRESAVYGTDARNLISAARRTLR
ncbi:hypothetical protein SCWH03_11300 [Streptomyces pacificus]|uniref:DUF5753 domain-containing protein n=1 Tax=Streptomyces pacificus TaxID=2705029 RepID=A0A6A0API3_9ACTN|nr:hypothetical protein SCWH03_11300 [Streptomyces pacificus]